MKIIYQSRTITRVNEKLSFAPPMFNREGGGGVPYGKKWRISSLWYVGDNFRLSTKEEEEQLSIIIRDEHTKWKLETSNPISPFPLIEYNKQQQPSTCFFFFFF